MSTTTTTTQPPRNRSYGIILLRPLQPSPSTSTFNPSTQNTQVLLIHQRTSNPNRTFWGFPKGRAEVGDVSVKHSAVRELFEETNLSISLSDIIEFNTVEEGDEEKGDGVEEEIKFVERYSTPGRTKGKEVRFWVAVVRGEEAEREIRVQEKEVVEAEWCEWEEARGRLQFEETTSVMDRVGKLLDKRAGEGR